MGNQFCTCLSTKKCHHLNIIQTSHNISKQQLVTTSENFQAPEKIKK